jgi:hypothetical protein
MGTLGVTHGIGGRTEDYVVKMLKKELGDENVKQIGDLGSKEDMISGIDCKVTINGEEKNAQIKPYADVKLNNNEITIIGSGQVKKYPTDLIIFSNQNKGVLVFSNNNTKIINGQYVIPEEDLIYKLT